MLKLNKLLKFLGSWHLLNVDQKYSCIICGPDDFYQRKLFKSDYIFADVLSSNPIIFGNLLSSLKIFMKNITKIKFNLANLRSLFLVSSLANLISQKRIKNVICFIDYYKLGKIFKLVLGDKINVIGFQFSARGNPEKRLKWIEDYDQYYLWDSVDSNYSNNKKLINFGSLKSCVALEKYNMWNSINDNFTKPSKIILISTIAENYAAFFSNNLAKNNINIEKKLDVVGQTLEKKNKNFLREQQAYDFFRLTILLKKYLIKTKKPLEIILRGTKKFNRKLNYEKFIFNSLFTNNISIAPILIEKNFIDRLRYALENKNEIFITDCSSFGKELLALGCKVIFYSNIMKKYIPFFFDEKTIFCTSQKQKNFEDNIEKLEKFSRNEFNMELKKAKKTFNSFTPDYEKFSAFLKQSNMSIIK